MPLDFEEVVRIEILSRRLSSSHQKQMISHKARRIRGNQNPVDEHGKGHAPDINGLAKGDGRSRLIAQAVTEAAKCQEDAQKRARSDKSEEVAIIASANAVVEPEAMMILCFGAVVANATVMSARRSPYVAGLAVFGRNLHGGVGRPGSSDKGPFIQRGANGQRIIRLGFLQWMQITG